MFQPPPSRPLSMMGYLHTMLGPHHGLYYAYPSLVTNSSEGPVASILFSCSKG